jgi:hypothetical protein
MSTLTVTSSHISLTSGASASFPVSLEGTLLSSEMQMQQSIAKMRSVIERVNKKALEVQEAQAKKIAALESALATVETQLKATEIANQAKVDAEQKAKLAQKERADALQVRVVALESTVQWMKWGNQKTEERERISHPRLKVNWDRRNPECLEYRRFCESKSTCR